MTSLTIAMVIGLAGCIGPDESGAGRTPATTTVTTTTTSPVPPGGTFVGQKAQALKSDLARLDSDIAQHTALLQQAHGTTSASSQNYYSTVSAINAKLQAGTTPGNPILSQQWNTAQSALERVNDDVGQLNNLAALIGADATFASYLYDNIHAAFSLSGAIDEDHRALAELQDQLERSNINLNRLQTAISEDVSRQTNYVATERRNLTTLALGIKNGELYGGSLANQSLSPPSNLPIGVQSGLTAPISGSTGLGDRRPLVLISFDRPNVEYQQSLYNAVSQALDRRPNAAFDVVAVSPTSGSAQLSDSTTRRNAEAVMRSLTDMGLPPARVTLSQTMSNTAQTGQVALYVR